MFKIVEDTAKEFMNNKNLKLNVNLDYVNSGTGFTEAVDIGDGLRSIQIMPESTSKTLSCELEATIKYSNINGDSVVSGNLGELILSCNVEEM